MNNFKPPSSLDLSAGNVKENWKRFKQQFNLYIIAIEKSAASDETKNAIFLTVVGPECLDVYNTFEFTTADQVDENSVTIKHASLINKFDGYCTPRTNETYERYVFRMTVQKHLEPMDKFITDLKITAKSCNFGPLESSLVRVQIVIGVHDMKLKERLLREAELDLTRSESLAYASEVVHRK